MRRYYFRQRESNFLERRFEKRNQELYRYRLGFIDGRSHTYLECGKRFNISAGRARQIFFKVIHEIGKARLKTAFIKQIIQIRMHRTLVSSSNIRSIGYDSQSSTLEVEFTSGEIYQYFDVPEYLFQQFLSTSSHGQFLNDHIRYKYRYQKVS